MEDEKSESDIDMTEDNKSENQQITMDNTKIISKNGLCLAIRRTNNDTQTGMTITELITKKYEVIAQVSIFEPGL